MNYWLVKSEPDEFSFADLEAKGPSRWDGVRNYQARNNLRAMRLGDQVLYYHSREGLEIVGVAEVATEHYPDPTATQGDWSAVDLVALYPLPQPIPLATIKAHPDMQDLGLVRNPRLSVMPIPSDVFACLVKMGLEGLRI